MSTASAQPSADEPIFSATLTTNDGTAVVIVDGELDFSSGHRLEELVPVLLGLRSDRVVIDLGGLQFIDGSGIDVLLDCRRRLTAAGLDVALRNVSAETAAMAELLGLVQDIGGDVCEPPAEH